MQLLYADQNLHGDFNIVQRVLAAGDYKKLFPKFHAEYLFAFADRGSGEVFRIF